MKKFKLKKLIVLAMLGGLTGSVYVNAMEGNNIIINQNENKEFQKKPECYIEAKADFKTLLRAFDFYTHNNFSANSFISSSSEKLYNLLKVCYDINKSEDLSEEKRKNTLTLVLATSLKYMNLDSNLFWSEEIIEQCDSHIEAINEYEKLHPHKINKKEFDFFMTKKETIGILENEKNNIDKLLIEKINSLKNSLRDYINQVDSFKTFIKDNYQIEIETSLGSLNTSVYK